MQNSEHAPGMFLGATGSDDDWVNFNGTSAKCSQTLLWVHQDDWQKDLLVKYGNTITLIDATYKTTKYDLALFFFVCQDKCQLNCSSRIHCAV